MGNKLSTFIAEENPEINLILNEDLKEIPTLFILKG